MTEILVIIFYVKIAPPPPPEKVTPSFPPTPLQKLRPCQAPPPPPPPPTHFENFIFCTSVENVNFVLETNDLS